MPKVSREVRPVTRRPPRIALRVRALVRPVSVAAVEVEQQVHLSGDGVIEVRGGALDAALDGGAGAAGTRPGAEEARSRDLGEDGLASLVLHEAQEGLVVAAVGGRKGEDGQVDDVGGGVVDVALWGCEVLEVGCVGVADLGV